MANTTLTTFTGTMAKFLDEVDALKIGAETQKVTITGSSYTLDDLMEIRNKAINATIVLQAAANPQLEGAATDLIDALADIKYSGAITVSAAITNANLAGVLALTTGKVTSDVSGTAADLVEALEAEKTVNALTVTVDAGAVDASDLKILDAKTSVIVDASLVTAITGTAAELKTVLAVKTITLDTNAVAVTVDGKVSAADLNTIAKATGGVVTAEIEGSAAALNAALKDVNSLDHISVTLTGATATAKDILELNAKCPDFNGDSLQTITGTFAQMKLIADSPLNQALTITDTIKATDSDITALNSITNFASGAVKATVEGSAAVLAKLTASNSDLLTLKVTGDTATAVDLIKVNDATSLTVNASAVKEIRGEAADLKTIYTSKTISGLGNEVVTITAPASADAVNAILKATTGKVTATVTSTDAKALNADLKDAKATDALKLTVIGEATAADLKALDAKTSEVVTATGITLITGNAADVKTVLKAEGITLDKVTTDAVAVTVTGTVSAADVNTIAKATDGKVTATVAAGTAASLKAALTDVTATDALKLKVTGTATVADLLALHGKTSIPVDVKSVTAITGTAAEFVTFNALVPSVDLSSTVAVTVTGAIDASALNIIAGDTFGKVTATVEGSANDLKALTTASTDAITVKVTGATAAAADLIAIDKVTSVVVDAKAVKTITADAEDVADVAKVLAAKTIAKAADVAVTINPASDPADNVTALEANSIAKLTTGVVTATVADASASYLNTTLKDAKATDALKLTVIGTTATAADLNALDGKTSVKVEVTAATVTGTLADLNKIFVDVVTSTHFDVTATTKNVNITDKTVTANDVNKIAEATNAAVKATVTADSAANLVSALENTDTNNALTLTVNGTTAKASDLLILDDKTTVDVTVNATEVTGTFTELEAIYVTNKANFTALGNENINITGATAAQVNTIASLTTGKVTATLAANTAIDAGTVTALTHVNGTTDVISLTSTEVTADATALVALAAKVITADATAFNLVATITEDAATIGTNGANVVAALGIAGNDAAATITGAISAASADAIADATIGKVTAEVTAGTAAALNAALVDATAGANAYDLTVLDAVGTLATNLTGLDAKTSVVVDASAVTNITGSSAEVAAAYAADTTTAISGLGDETVHITGVDATVANLDAINGATTGLVTVTEVDTAAGAFSLASLYSNTADSGLGITGLTTVDATKALANTQMTINVADLFAVNDSFGNITLTINADAAKDTLDLTGWAKGATASGYDSYSISGNFDSVAGNEIYTVKVTTGVVVTL